MALDPERKVKPGDRMQIPAATYNSLIDMLREYKRNRGRFGANLLRSTIHPHNTVFIQNVTGNNLDSFNVLKITGILANLQFDPWQFSKRPNFIGDIPASKNDPIAITLVPSIGNNTDPSLMGSGSYDPGSVGSGESGETFSASVVPAIVSGIIVCLVNLTDLTHEWANPTPGITDYLTSDVTGQARILYWEALDGSTFVEASGSVSTNMVVAVVHLIGLHFALQTFSCEVLTDVSASATCNADKTITINLIKTFKTLTITGLEIEGSLV